MRIVISNLKLMVYTEECGVENSDRILTLQKGKLTFRRHLFHRAYRTLEVMPYGTLNLSGSNHCVMFTKPNISYDVCVIFNLESEIKNIFFL